MTDKLDKHLAKLSKKELLAVEAILLKLRVGDYEGLNLIRLKGYADIYRMRKGRIRIIFQQQAERVTLIDIDRRNEKTYKDL